MFLSVWYCHDTNAVNIEKSLVELPPTREMAARGFVNTQQKNYSTPFSSLEKMDLAQQNGATTLSKMTFGIPTLSITTPSMKGLFAIIKHN
jgi:hypothetical protein